MLIKEWVYPIIEQVHRHQRRFTITRHDCETLPSCVATSSNPTLARITFGPVVIVLSAPFCRPPRTLTVLKD